MTAPSMWRDATRTDLIVAIVISAAVQALSVSMVSLTSAATRTRSPPPAAPRLDWAVPVAVVANPEPVVVGGANESGVSARLKLGGGTGENPKAHARPVHLPRAETARSAAATHARAVSGVAPLVTAGVGVGPATRGSTPSEPIGAGLADSPPVLSDGVEPVAWDGPAGPGFPDGEVGGTVIDPLQAHAIRLYRGRLEAWFSTLFRVTGSGLAPEVLRQTRVRARVSVDDGRRVLSYTIVASGVTPFDVAARDALNAATGRELPPPPDNYPGTLQRHLDVTFVCSEGQCD